MVSSRRSHQPGLVRPRRGRRAPERSRYRRVRSLTSSHCRSNHAPWTRQRCPASLITAGLPFGRRSSAGDEMAVILRQVVAVSRITVTDHQQVPEARLVSETACARLTPVYTKSADLNRISPHIERLAPYTLAQDANWEKVVSNFVSTTTPRWHPATATSQTASGVCWARAMRLTFLAHRFGPAGPTDVRRTFSDSGRANAGRIGTRRRASDIACSPRKGASVTACDHDIRITSLEHVAAKEEFAPPSTQTRVVVSPVGASVRLMSCTRSEKPRLRL